ncbi:MAG: hypothetical protein KAT56_00555, partial [Sedimentisphaerales bacterium]|nr:hypothetical protein [Sedimentisphaerales bacterium]
EVIMQDREPLYYGSRCDRYNVKKDKVNTDHLPDLFRQRQQMLERFARLDKESVTRKKDRKFKGTVGLPLCLSNYQYLPLWGTFLDELGFEVVLSGRSTRDVIQKGVAGVLSETCFPVKVAHGHVLTLVEKQVDYIWLPSIVSMQKDYPENVHNQLCPYVQTIPYLVKMALKAKGIDLTGRKNHLIDLPVRFQDGLKTLRRTLRSLTEKLNVTKAQINRAIDVATETQKSFEQACVGRGREILSELKPEQKACVVVSRPYNGCDPGVSLDLPRKLRKMNVLAIPMDFLDLAGANITEPELQRDMYWKYGQRIFRAAHIIRENPRLNAVYMSNFSCGPDSFIITFFKELMTITDPDGSEYRKPALVLEIDEHSADAGVITRLEAFHESLKAVEQRRKPTTTITKAPSVQSPDSPWRCEWGDCSGRMLYVPYMGDCSHAMAAAFRHCGQDSHVIPLGDEETLRWGRKFTSGKECLPCIITMGDMLQKINEPGFDPNKAAFFMPGSSGPCRFGQYNCLQRLALKQSGFSNSVPVVSPNQDSSFYDAFRRFKKDPTRLAYNGIAMIDLLGKVLLKVRPYEQEPHQADDAYQKCLQRIIGAIDAGMSEKELIGQMEICANEMSQVPLDKSRQKPLVSVVGEIYVRNHTFANDNIVRHLEELGAEVNLAGFVEWLYYTNHTRRLMARRWSDPKLFVQNVIKNHLQHKIERRLAEPLERQFGPLAEGDIRDVIKMSDPYIHESFEGEAVLSAGKMIEMYHHGTAGAVSVGPFTCMPSSIVSAASRQITRDCRGLPIINISYDGQQDPTLPTRLEAFMHQVHNFDRSRTAGEVPVHAQ